MAGFRSFLLNYGRPARPGATARGLQDDVAARYRATAQRSAEQVLADLHSEAAGLDEREAARRLETYGLNA
ncbi:MAG TPA: cation-transporting P-type ATPase, partial [Alphaproteobacteria bacterium]|nr:cation-transporting P-type ATPase [Alphaproteobacteria bacterium]